MRSRCREEGEIITLPVCKAPTKLRLDDSPTHGPLRSYIGLSGPFDPCHSSSLELNVEPQGSYGLHALSRSPIKQYCSL